MQKPYLIQRASINRHFTPLNRLSEAVSFDYMGSAEFEFGALPKSFKNMFKNRVNLKLHTVQSIRENNKPLNVYGAFSNDELKQYVSWLTQIRNNDRTLRLKERARFEAGETHTNFWWDITNDVMFSFDIHFMNALPKYVENSWRYMKLM